MQTVHKINHQNMHKVSIFQKQKIFQLGMNGIPFHII